VHGEQQRAVLAGGVQAGQDVLRVGLEAVGVVVADVRVRVEPRRVADVRPRGVRERAEDLVVRGAGRGHRPAP
jgi:hypothetical protein